MNIDVDKSIGKLGAIAKTMLQNNPAISDTLADCDLRIGPATNSRYGSDTGALACPTYVGDSAHLSKTGYTSEVATAAKNDPKSVGRASKRTSVGTVARVSSRTDTKITIS